MSSNSIYKPYFYIIQNVLTKKYYAGSRWSKYSDPLELLTEGGYCTSSKTVLKLIERYGISTFIVRKIKVFSKGNEAYEYETKFLKRVNASKNPMFYNLHNNNNALCPQKLRNNMLECYGVEYPFMLPAVQEKIRIVVKERYGVDNISQLEEIKKKKLITKKKYRIKNVR
jgi:hypothetical protein